MNLMDLEDVAVGFGRLADPQRLRVLELLAAGEKSAGELLSHLSISQPTLSHHMKILCDGGLVLAKRQGQRTLYQLNHLALSTLFQTIHSGAVRPVSPKAPSVIVRSGHNRSR